MSKQGFKAVKEKWFRKFKSGNFTINDYKQYYKELGKRLKYEEAESIFIELKRTNPIMKEFIIKNNIKNSAELAITLFEITQILINEDGLTYSEAIIVIKTYYNISKQTIQKLFNIYDEIIALVYDMPYGLSNIEVIKGTKRVTALTIVKKIIQKIKGKVNVSDQEELKMLEEMIFEYLYEKNTQTT